MLCWLQLILMEILKFDIAFQKGNFKIKFKQTESGFRSEGMLNYFIDAFGRSVKMWDRLRGERADERREMRGEGKKEKR